MEEKVVIVVEGQSDVNKLRNIVNADFVLCNGSAISKETIDYIKELSKTRKIIILTDPDYPGSKIRDTIAKEVKSCYHAFVDRNKSIKGKKLGVAECDKEEILRALSNYVNLGENKNTLSFQDYINFGLSGNDNSSKLRDYVAKKFNLGHCNAKTLYKRLNMIGIKKEELKEAIDAYCE